MDMPATGTEAEARPAEAPGSGSGVWEKFCEGWKARESLWIGIIILLLGVLGQILLYLIPSEDYATNSTYADYQLIGSLRVLAEAANYLGAIWVGVYLARWGLRRKKD